MSFNDEVQFDLSFYRSACEPGLAGEKGIPLVHVMDCCVRWSAVVKPQFRTTRHLLECISLAWVNVFGGMGTLTLDGEIGMGGEEVDDWAMYGQMAMKHKSRHQKAWLVERHDVSIRSASHRAGPQVIKESFWITCNVVLSLVAFMHNAFVSVDGHTPYQAIVGWQPNSLPPLQNTKGEIS